MCIATCKGSPDNCDCCISLRNEIIDFFGDSIDNHNIKLLNQAFDYIKQIPKKYTKLEKRKNGEHYLVHLVETTRILLKISPNISFKQVIVALLHDSIEDVDDIDIVELTSMFGHQIASSVERLSKIPINVDPGTSDEEIKKRKLRRNQLYFEKLEFLDDEDLDVKFADRIHNLKTLYKLDRNFIERTIDDTLKYFIPLAKKRNRRAFDMMFDEVLKVLRYLKSGEVDGIVIQTV